MNIRQRISYSAVNPNPELTTSARTGMKMVAVAMLLVKLVMMVAMIHISVTIRTTFRFLKLDSATPIELDSPDACQEQQNLTRILKQNFF